MCGALCVSSPPPCFQVGMPSKHRLVSVCCFSTLVLRDKCTDRCKCSNASGFGVGTGKMQHFFCSDRQINSNTTPRTWKKLLMIGYLKSRCSNTIGTTCSFACPFAVKYQRKGNAEGSLEAFRDVFKACSLLLLGLLIRHPLSHA